jgi:hypothetical protein
MARPESPQIGNGVACPRVPLNSELWDKVERNSNRPGIRPVSLRVGWGSFGTRCWCRWQPVDRPRGPTSPIAHISFPIRSRPSSRCRSRATPLNRCQISEANCGITAERRHPIARINGQQPASGDCDEQKRIACSCAYDSTRCQANNRSGLK